MEHRQERRYVFCQRLSLTIGHAFGRGEVVDWSEHGIHIVSSVPLEETGVYKVRFHVSHDRGLMSPQEIWSREGTTQWITIKENLWHCGVNLHELGQHGWRKVTRRTHHANCDATMVHSFQVTDGFTESSQ